MEKQLSTVKIRKLAQALDDSIESQNVEEIASYFSENCEIELPGITLYGKDGLRKAVAWMYRYFHGITLVPIIIMVNENTFFEEFILRAKNKKGKEVQVKMTEVLVYDDTYKVRSLRLYFDRLELAGFTSSPIEKMIINKLNKASLKGLL